MTIRGFLLRKLKKKIKKKPKKEVYLKTESVEEYRKAVRKGTSYELSEKTAEVMDLNKKLDERDETIKQLLKKKSEREEEELSAQEEVLKKLKKSRVFTSLWTPEKPVVLVSSYNSEPFVDEYGEPRPYVVGFEIRSAPFGPFIVPLMAKKPKGKKGFLGAKDIDVAYLETDPPITFDAIHQLFPNLQLLVHTMKTGGVIPVNITPDGYFTGTVLPFRVKAIIPAVKKKIIEVKKKTPKKKVKRKK